MKLKGIYQRLTEEMRLEGKVIFSNISTLSDNKYINSAKRTITQSRQNQNNARYQINLYESTSV